MNSTFFKTNFKEVFSLVLLFIVLYLEPIQIGGLKISQIWKGIVVFLILTFLFKKRLPIFYWFGLLFSFKFLLYSNLPYGVFNNFRLFLESLIFPLALGYLYIYFKNKNNLEYLIHLGLLLSIFLIYSSVPFLLGLESLYPEYDLSEKYNINLSATKGIFYHIASASKMFTVATVYLFIFRNKFKNSKLNRLFWLVSFLIGNFLIVMSWTRTAWFIYLSAILIAVFYKSKLKIKLLGIISFFIFSIGVSYVYETNQAFRWRMTGGASYREETELSFEQLLNARAPYIVTAIDNMKDEGLASTFLGYGEQRGIDMFEEKTNMAITSHNATFEILESNGVLGLFFYILFIGSLIKLLKRYWNYIDPLYKKTTLIMLFLLICFYLSSHGTPLWGELIYAFLFTYVILQGRRNKIDSLNKINKLQE